MFAQKNPLTNHYIPYTVEDPCQRHANEQGEGSKYVWFITRQSVT